MIRSSLLPACNFHWRGCKLPAAFLICCCFILFHRGHLDYYQKSAARNNSDVSTGADNGIVDPLESVLPDGVEVNNFGPHLGLQVVKDRQRNATADELKWVHNRFQDSFSSMYTHTGISSFGTRPTEARSMTWVLAASLSTKLAVLRRGALPPRTATWRSTRTSTPSSSTSAVSTGTTFLTGGRLSDTSLGKKMTEGHPLSKTYIFLYKPWSFCQLFDMFNKEYHAYWHLQCKCQWSMRIENVIYTRHVS